MLDLLVSYWWATLAIGAVAGFLAVQSWARRTFDAQVQDILEETQAGFAHGSAEVHSIKAVRTMTVQDETAIVYQIDATIIPSNEAFEWCGSDLFLRGVDGDPNQIGDVLTAKRWNGTTFEQIRNRARLVGTQRLLLSMRFAGSPGRVRFNFNFANFGQDIQLPELEVVV